jgi:hypothetical protein
MSTKKIFLFPGFIVCCTLFFFNCMDPFLRPDPPYTTMAMDLVLGSPGSRNLQAPMDFQGKGITVELRRNSATSTLVDRITQTLGAPDTSGSFTLSLEFNQVPTLVDLVLVGTLYDTDGGSTSYFRGVSTPFKADSRISSPVTLDLERIDYSSNTQIKLTSFQFYQSLNPALPTTLIGTVSPGTNQVEVLFPWGTSVGVFQDLIATFAHTGVQAVFNGSTLISSHTAADYSFQPVLTLLDGQGNPTEYVIDLFIQGTLLVQFDSNGGTGTMDPISATGTSLFLPSHGFTKSGSTFTGWNTQADGTGTGYAPNGTLLVTTGLIRLYAQWQEDTLSSNADLTSLNVGTGTLSPSFDPNHLSYNLYLFNASSTVTVDPTPADFNAMVTISGDSVSGNSVNLQPGINVITIHVQAEDGITTKTYSLTIYREYDLTSFSTGEHTLTLFGNPSTTIWGTDIYTHDSRLSTVAVHAGIVLPQVTATVKINRFTVDSSFQYIGTTRNGVTSSGWTNYTEAFQITGVSQVYPAYFAINSNQLSILTSTPGATIGYTTDGADPSSGIVYSAPILLETSLVNKTLRVLVSALGLESVERAVIIGESGGIYYLQF